jgi:hypothetical protein
VGRLPASPESKNTGLSKLALKKRQLARRWTDRQGAPTTRTQSAEGCASSPAPSKMALFGKNEDLLSYKGSYSILINAKR